VVYESTVSGQGNLSGPPYLYDFDFAGTSVAGNSFAYWVRNDSCSGTMDCVQFGANYRFIAFIDPSGSVLTNDVMPSTSVLQSFPDIGLWDITSGTLFYAPVDTLTFRVIPEPTTALLLAAGLAGLAAVGRRRSLR
jgi:hypothetical protein